MAENGKKATKRAGICLELGLCRNLRLGSVPPLLRSRARQSRSIVLELLLWFIRLSLNTHSLRELQSRQLFYHYSKAL